jgi:hypothetical protein
MLTIEEEKELAELEAQEKAKSNLTPDEEVELAQLEASQNQDTASGIRALPGIALGTLGKAAETYDKYGGGASARSGIMALLQGENPFSAAYNQYGKSGAPTGQDILEASPLKTPQFVKDTASKQTYQPGYGGYGAIPQMNKGVGAIVEMALDPAQAIPFVGGAKLATVGGVKTLGMAAKGAAIGTDILTGTKIAGPVANATEKVIQGTAKYLNKMAKPTIRPDYSELQNIAKKYGIDEKSLPDVFEFGKESVISRSQRAKAATPSGEGELNKFIESRKNISNALDTQIHGSPTNGLPTASPAETGVAIRARHDVLKKEVIANSDFTYSTTANQMGNIPVNPQAKGNITRKFNEWKSVLENDVKEGATQQARAEASEILDIVNRLQNSTNNVQSFARRIQELGQVAFDPKVQGTEFRRTSGILPQVYSEAKKAFIDTTRSKLGNGIADTLIQNNKNISDFLQKSKGLRKILQNPNDEQVFRTLTSNTDNAKNLVDLMPELKKDIAATTIEQFIRRDSSGVIQNWSELRQQFGKKKIDVLKNLVDDKQAEAIHDLVMLGEEVGPMPTNAPSQGVSGAWRNITENVSDEILRDAAIETLKNKARSSSGIQSLMDMADRGTLKSNKGIKALSEISEHTQEQIRRKIPGFSARKSILRETQSVKDSKKDKK